MNGGLPPIGAIRIQRWNRPQSTQTRPSRPRQWVIGSARKRPFAPDSPLCGNRRLGQFVEQRLGGLEVGGVEAFGEPGVDRGEQLAGVALAALPTGGRGSLRRAIPKTWRSVRRQWLVAW